MASLALLIDIVGKYGGAERYWETVMPHLARRYDVRLLARAVEEPGRFGVPATQVPWSDENSEPSPEAARAVADAIRGCDAVITASVFDVDVLSAVRSASPRWIARAHDYRAFCPNGNKVFPQFPAVCTVHMGTACAVNAVLRGCVRGPKPESFRRIGARMRVRDAYARADFLFVGSAYVRQSCIRDGVPADRVHVTPPPLPHAAYTDPRAMPAENTILFSGRFNDKKGLGSLIRALGCIAQSKRPELVVAGAGDPAEETRGRAAAEKCGVRVQWRGWLPIDRLREEIDRARIVAVPSLWPEPFGLTGIEGHARGRPAVAFDVGGVTEWMDGGGIAVKRDDVQALAHAIEHITDSEAVWRQYSAAARAGAERYRVEPHMKTLYAAIEQ